MSHRILAIIPAREGSKRLPKKNIKIFAGKPLIEWTIDNALKSTLIDTVMVSTDCSKITEISKNAGAQVPFTRPEELSGDEISTVDVVLHALNYYKKAGEHFTHIMLLQPTSPLRNISDINNAIKMLNDKNADSIISVCEVEHSPLWCNTLPENRCFDGFLRPDVVGKRSQELPVYYRLNGAIYLAATKGVEKLQSLHTLDNTFAYVMSKNNSIDIDDEIDFIKAEFIMNEILIK